MKLILLLALAVLMPLTYAGRTRPRLPLIRELVRKTPWQNIAAGGAAAGTVIVASKVGNGVESGLQTVARKNPDAFASCVTPRRIRKLRHAAAASVSGGVLYFDRERRHPDCPAVF